MKKGTTCLESAQTNGSGKVTFLVESEKIYYFSVVKDGKTNSLDTFCQFCSNSSKTVNVSTTISEEVGTVRLNNNATGSDSGIYKFTVKNTTIGFSKTYTVSAGSYKDLTDMPLGNYSVYMEQQDGYTFYATTGTLQNGYMLTFSTNSL